METWAILPPLTALALPAGLIFLFSCLAGLPILTTSYTAQMQTIAMLQRLGHVSYRALIRQFALDEDYFADLKDALLYACPEMIDDGRGFIWSGATETSLILPQRVQDARLTQDAFPSPLSPPPDAEHR